MSIGAACAVSLTEAGWEGGRGPVGPGPHGWVEVSRGLLPSPTSPNLCLSVCLVSRALKAPEVTKEKLERLARGD